MQADCIAPSMYVKSMQESKYVMINMCTLMETMHTCTRSTVEMVMRCTAHKMKNNLIGPLLLPSENHIRLHLQCRVCSLLFPFFIPDTTTRTLMVRIEDDRYTQASLDSKELKIKNKTFSIKMSKCGSARPLYYLSSS